MAELDDWLNIGRIVAPQGMNGEVRVYPMSDFPERFLEPGERWLLRPNDTDPQPIQIESGRFISGKGLYVLQLKGIRYRDQAEKLRDCLLMVPATDRPLLEDDEYHVMDLLGLAVFHHDTGDRIGTVKDVIPAGNDLLEVELVAPPLSGSNDDRPEDATATANQAVTPPTASIPETLANADTPKVPSSSLRRKGRRAMAKAKRKKNKPPKARTVLIPFVPELVPIVDLEEQRITISPLPGLLSDEVETGAIPGDG